MPIDIDGGRSNSAILSDMGSQDKGGKIADDRFIGGSRPRMGRVTMHRVRRSGRLDRK